MPGDDDNKPGKRPKIEERTPTSRDREHRDYSDRRASRAMLPLGRPSRELTPSAEDAAPDYEMDDASARTPVGGTPQQLAEFYSSRANSRSNLALREAQSVRGEMRSEIHAINNRLDEFGTTMTQFAREQGAISAELKVLNGLLAERLKAGDKVQEMALGAAVGAATAKAQAEIDGQKAAGAHALDEKKAAGAFWRDAGSKVVLALLAILGAVQAWLLATK